MWKRLGVILWNLFEKMLSSFASKVLCIKMESGTWKKFIQFGKFAMVGLSNVIVSYGVYILFFGVFQAAGVLYRTDYLVAQLLGYVLSIFWSFYWNWKYVFKDEQDAATWYVALIKSFIAYSFTGIFLNSLLSFIWVEIIEISKIIAPVINLMINVPVNFLMNKFWAFSKKRV